MSQGAIYLGIRSVGKTAPHPLRLRCPNCGTLAGFEPLQEYEPTIDAGAVKFRTTTVVERLATIVVGARSCPNIDCRALVLVTYTPSAPPVVVDSYPPEVIGFVTDGIPPRIVSALSEAIVCHAAGCFTASAMLIRKTLELLCDEQGAEGDNLKQRVEALAETIVLPRALIDGLDELRLLGNDAAHVKARAYESIGPDESEVAIEFTKEVLKGLYQQARLVERLRSLKRHDAASS